MNRELLFLISAVSLVTTVGMLTATALTIVLDQAAFAEAITHRDEDGIISNVWWHRYLTQAVESYVFGSALAIMLTMGMLTIVLAAWLRRVHVVPE